LALDELLERERLPREFWQVIEHAYVPLVERIVLERRSRSDALVVGLCGPQGSGKSTLALVMQALLRERDVTAAILSLDDLYLTRAERLALSKRVHPLLETRGVPGTHDVRLGLSTMEALRASDVVALPSFDKALDERRPREQWPKVQAPVQAIILEGWCVGAVPQSAPELAKPVNALERDFDFGGIWRRYVNETLAGEYQRLFVNIDLLILLKAPSFDVVYGWRVEQEHKLRERVEARHGGAGHIMSDAQIEHFVSHYERLTRHILAEMPNRADVVVHLDAARRPTSVELKSPST
jgi:D-glycerate 3-kinase